MLRSIARSIRRTFRPSLAWLEEQAAQQGCTVQHRMDIDERNRWFPKEFRKLFGGFNPPGEQREYLRAFGLDHVRSDMLALLLREIVTDKIPGSIAELGVHQGASARLIHHYCPERRLYLLDTFEGFKTEDLKAETVPVGFNGKDAFGDTSVELVRRNIAPVNDSLRFVRGWFPQSVTDEMRADRFAFVHLDADLEAPITAGLEFFWPRLEAGGMVVVHDYNAWPGARTAVDAFRARLRLLSIPMPDKSGSVVLRKSP
jgi:O-methyltransferase